MSDNTTLNAGTGGDTIVTEELVDGSKIPLTKLATGEHGRNDGSVTASNPLPVSAEQMNEVISILRDIRELLFAGTS